MVNPDGLKKGLGKFKRNKKVKQPTFMIKPTTIDMNQQVQLSQNTSKTLIVPKFQTTNIID